MQPAAAVLSPKTRPRKPQAHAQAVAIQLSLASIINLCTQDAAATSDRELRARIGTAIGNMAKAWDTLEDRKRVLRNKPLPGSMRPDVVRAKRVQASRPIWPLLEAPPAAVIETDPPPS